MSSFLLHETQNLSVQGLDNTNVSAKLTKVSCQYTSSRNILSEVQRKFWLSVRKIVLLRFSMITFIKIIVWTEKFWLSFYNRKQKNKILRDNYYKTIYWAVRILWIFERVRRVTFTEIDEWHVVVTSWHRRNKDTIFGSNCLSVSLFISYCDPHTWSTVIEVFFQKSSSN